MVNIFEKLSVGPVLWDLFEAIFGANREKQRIYREVICDKGRMLDFGCSTGITTGAFLDFEYYGIDIDKRCIDRARAKWSNSKNVHFVCANLLDKPFSESFFNFILFAGTGHHLKDKEVDSLLLEMHRILKPGGNIYFFDILRVKKTDKLLKKWLVAIDRGKYVRSEEEWLEIFKKNSLFLILEKKVISPQNTLIPQPDYCYFKLRNPNGGS